jgi:hypothetical protein
MPQRLLHQHGKRRHTLAHVVTGTAASLMPLMARRRDGEVKCRSSAALTAAFVGGDGRRIPPQSRG